MTKKVIFWNKVDMINYIEKNYANEGNINLLYKIYLKGREHAIKAYMERRQ